MKKILLFAALLVTVAFAQNSEMTKHLGVSIGSHIREMYKVLGKPDSVWDHSSRYKILRYDNRKINDQSMDGNLAVHTLNDTIYYMRVTFQFMKFRYDDAYYSYEQLVRDYKKRFGLDKAKLLEDGLKQYYVTDDYVCYSTIEERFYKSMIYDRKKGDYIGKFGPTNEYIGILHDPERTYVEFVNSAYRTRMQNSVK